jgi:hypothetical protein
MPLKAMGLSRPTAGFPRFSSRQKDKGPNYPRFFLCGIGVMSLHLPSSLPWAQSSRTYSVLVGNRAMRILRYYLALTCRAALWPPAHIDG